jgi:tight adherence protein C
MSSTLTVIGIFVLLFISIMMFVLAFAKPKEKDDIAVRLEKIKTKHEDLKQKQEDERYKKIRNELNLIAKKIAPFAEKTLNEKSTKSIENKLIKAGKYDASVINFATNRILLAIAFPLVFIAIGVTLLELTLEDAIMYSVVLAVLGYIFPVVRLNRLIEDRQKEVFRSLPDTLDLLTICLEAGMGINEALNKVVEKTKPNALRDEIDRTLREIQLGNPRLQALRDMSKRIDLKELSSVIISIIQAEQMGTSLAKTLKVQSEIIRDIRWQKAQEMAQKAPVKMIIPIALFIFPTIFVVIFGPLVINFMFNSQ